MELRKLTMVVFLNDDLDKVREVSTAKMGTLRLFSEGNDPLAEVYDIVPRMGRAVLFKSEKILHKVNPTLEWDNYAATFYFNQVVQKPQKHHPIPSNWKTFVGIISYRDPYLLSTLKALTRLATHPQNLRIVIFNQMDLESAEDKKMLDDIINFA